MDKKIQKYFLFLITILTPYFLCITTRGSCSDAIADCYYIPPNKPNNRQYNVKLETLTAPCPGWEIDEGWTCNPAVKFTTSTKPKSLWSQCRAKAEAKGDNRKTSYLHNIHGCICTKNCA